MASVHPTAIVEAGAELDADVSIGPYAIIGPHVKIGARTNVGPHCVIGGRTTIGADNRFHAHCAIGGDPQDKKYRDEPTRLEIGDRNTIREFCTFSTGTVQGGGVTRFGSDNWIMAYVHIAHDCIVGDRVTFANCTQLAGHVQIGDWVTLGGFTGVHQFCRIGAHVMTGVATKLVQDVPPFVMAEGNPAAARGLNVEGLRRRGFNADDIAVVKRAYKILYREGRLLDDAKTALDALAADSGSAHVRAFADFVAVEGRGLIR